MYEKILNGCLGLFLALAAAGVLFPKQAGSVVLAVFPAAERPEIDEHGNPRATTNTLAKFLNLFGLNKRLRGESLELLRNHWQPGEVGLLLETMPFVEDGFTTREVYEILRTNTKQSLPDQLSEWRKWYENSQIPEDPRSGRLKAELYGQHSPAVRRYFESETPPRVRLDRIEVGNCLPEKMLVLTAPEWKPIVAVAPPDPSSIVFGIECGGVGFALPRALAWTWDAIQNRQAGREFFFVYDRDTGAAACFWNAPAKDAPQLAVTGMRYGKTLLLADEATNSLWRSDTGEAVTGPMGAQNAKLKQLPVRAVEWKAWRQRHAKSLVLATPAPEQESPDE